MTVNYRYLKKNPSPHTYVNKESIFNNVNIYHESSAEYIYIHNENNSIVIPSQCKSSIESPLNFIQVHLNLKHTKI